MKKIAPQKMNYDSLIKSFRESLPQNPSRIRSIGRVKANGREYGLVKIILGEGNAKRVLISAGIHGDEYAGIKAISAFIEKRLYKEFDAEWELTILPCLNPTGCEQETRTNHEGKDLNRLFKSDSPPEEVAFAQKILNTPFDLNLELHEDIDSSGFYIYMKGNPATDAASGRKVVTAMEKFMPANMDLEIEGIRAEHGLLAKLSDPNQMDWWPMAMYAVDKGSRTSFTIETSTHFPIETRVDCHLTAIQTAMRIHTNFK